MSTLDVAGNSNGEIPTKSAQRYMRERDARLNIAVCPRGPVPQPPPNGSHTGCGPLCLLLLLAPLTIFIVSKT